MDTNAKTVTTLAKVDIAISSFSKVIGKSSTNSTISSS